MNSGSHQKRITPGFSRETGKVAASTHMDGNPIYRDLGDYFRVADNSPTGQIDILHAGTMLLFSNCSWLPRLESVPVVLAELSKADGFAAENMFYISSHGSSLALAIEPLEIKESVGVPLRNARR